MKSISLCLTVFNEEGTVSLLLDSILKQTKKPSEIVICDGGSTDGTVDIIKRRQEKHRNIKLIVSPGSVAHGRNIAIKHAKGEIIVCIDAGCTAKRDWLALLRQGFGKQGSLDIVAGFYEMKYKTPFQKIMALYRGTPPERYDSKTFIPSCRSVAFKKSVWKELGGFNEKLALSGEDTQFFYRALSTGYKMARIKSALVEWREPEQFGLKDFKKFFYYARGDAQTKIWWDPIKKFKTHNIKIETIFVRYLILLFFLIGSFTSPFPILPFFLLLCLYIFWSIWKWRDVVIKWNERLWIPVVQIGTDIMVMAGFLVGLLTKNSFSD